MWNSFWHNLPQPFKVLAPMEDVTDTVFRRVVASCGRPDVFFTEFTSTDGLFSKGRERVAERLEYTEGEGPLVSQIWGNKPENYLKACIEMRERGFDGIDINMGCPVAKIAAKGCCSGLIENPNLAKELILAAREGAKHLPVSVKTRLGYRDLRTEEWTGFLLDLDLPVITIHGRVAKHQSKYPANWDEIGKVVRLRDQMQKKTLIIGNGDVFNQEDFHLRHRESKVNGIMIGRGIFQNLYIFNDQGITNMSQLTAEQKLNLLLSHIALHSARWGTQTRYTLLKKFYKIYINGFPLAGDLRAKLMETEDIEQALALINPFLSSVELDSDNARI